MYIENIFFVFQRWQGFLPRWQRWPNDLHGNPRRYCFMGIWMCSPSLPWYVHFFDFAQKLIRILLFILFFPSLQVCMLKLMLSWISSPPTPIKLSIKNLSSKWINSSNNMRLFLSRTFSFLTSNLIWILLNTANLLIYLRINLTNKQLNYANRMRKMLLITEHEFYSNQF